MAPVSRRLGNCPCLRGGRTRTVPTVERVARDKIREVRCDSAQDALTEKIGFHEKTSPVEMARDDPAERARERVDAVYRAESRRVLATLIRLLGDFDLAEEALHDAFGPRSSSGRARACRPIRARGWCRPAGSRRSTACAGARASTPLDELGDAARRAVADDRGRADDGERRGRPAAADLHLLPPGAGARRAGRAHAARSVRADDRGDRARVSDAAAHAGAAHRAREGQDSRRADSVSGAGARRAARAARRGAARDLSRLQRRLLGFVRRRR